MTLQVYRVRMNSMGLSDKMLRKFKAGWAETKLAAPIDGWRTPVIEEPKVIKCLLVGGPADGRVWDTASRVFEVIQYPPIDFTMNAFVGGKLPDGTDATYKRHFYAVMELFPHPPLQAFVALPAMFGNERVPEDWHPVWMRCFEAGAVAPLENWHDEQG